MSLYMHDHGKEVYTISDSVIPIITKEGSLLLADVVNADPQQCKHYNVISMYTEEHWHMQCYAILGITWEIPSSVTN